MIKVYGGAIHTYTSQSAEVAFTGNESITLEYISIINKHDSNFCFKDLYAHGGAIYTTDLKINLTEKMYR